VLCTSETLSMELFPPHVRGLAPLRISRAKSGGIQKLCSELVTLGLMEAGDDAQDVHEKIVSLVEKEVLLQVLRTCQGTQTKAAVRLGINRNTLHKKIEDYSLQSEAR
jgi:DNA-binding protein Fis